MKNILRVRLPFFFSPPLDKTRFCLKLWRTKLRKCGNSLVRILRCTLNEFTSWTSARTRQKRSRIRSLTRASMYSILLSRAVSFSFSVAKRDLQDISEEGIVQIKKKKNIHSSKKFGFSLHLIELISLKRNKRPNLSEDDCDNDNNTFYTASLFDIAHLTKWIHHVFCIIITTNN